LATPRLKIFVFGSSLTSSYWNGAATYYRGIYQELYRLGYDVAFAEPDIYRRQQNRDLVSDPDYARCIVYRGRAELDSLLVQARDSDLIVKHSGVGAEDDYLEAAVLDTADAAPAGSRPRVAFWDVDAPATLAAIEASPAHHLRALLPRYDFVLTYGGGPPVVRRYLHLGARNCYPIYNALDPLSHYPVPPDPAWAADLTFQGHRLPDREARVHGFFFQPAEACPERDFLLAGEGWGDAALPANVRWVGHAPTAVHNVMNCSARLVLNINRECMARCGFSPPTRVFEAAGAGACLVTDDWCGIELFFQPGSEILVASTARDVARFVNTVSAAEASEIGRRMRARALEEHTYARRAARLDEILHAGLKFPRPIPAAA
jgi:spore maturation protein CgeB